MRIPGNLHLFPLALLLLSLSAAATEDELLKLTPAGGAPVDWAGTSVALEGGVALVGSPGDDEQGAISGSAAIIDATSGETMFVLVAADGAAGDQFGGSVALDGGLALVGAAFADGGGVESGAAYLFDAVTGLPLAKLLPSDGQAGDRFGFSVAIDGPLALIGATYDSDHGTHSGAAYLFNANTGQELVKLVATDGTHHDEFGCSVALSADQRLALVGALEDDIYGLGSGSAYLFDVTTGQQLAKLVPSSGSADAEFGASVALAGDLALVGAPRDDTVFVFSAATFQELRQLTPSDGPGKDFGCSVSLDGHLAILGAFRDPLNGPVAGSAYLFDAQTGAELAKLVPSDVAGWNKFGSSVAIDSGLVVAGSPFADALGTDSGAAYVFLAAEPGTSVGNGDSGCPCGNDNDGSNGIAGCASGVSSGGALLRASGSASVAADDLVLTACDQEAGNFMLWYQAPNVAGTPATFGDGLRVAVGSPAVYLHVEQLSGAHGTTGGASTRGVSLVTGGGIIPGQTVCYQTWYRDSTGLPCGNGFNTSNGYTVTWTP